MKYLHLCLHTLRADCNSSASRSAFSSSTLPPHAPCRLQRRGLFVVVLKSRALPPHAPCRLQLPWCAPPWRGGGFASTRSVQIATRWMAALLFSVDTLPPHAPCRLQHGGKLVVQARLVLCLHTLRADCNGTGTGSQISRGTLPPHAPCRLQPRAFCAKGRGGAFASTRSVQIATAASPAETRGSGSLPPHAPCRLQRQKCTECNMHFSERVLSR